MQTFQKGTFQNGDCRNGEIRKLKKQIVKESVRLGTRINTDSQIDLNSKRIQISKSLRHALSVFTCVPTPERSPLKKRVSAFRRFPVDFGFWLPAPGTELRGLAILTTLFRK